MKDSQRIYTPTTECMYAVFPLFCICKQNPLFQFYLLMEGSQHIHSIDLKSVYMPGSAVPHFPNPVTPCNLLYNHLLANPRFYRQVIAPLIKAACVDIPSHLRSYGICALLRTCCPMTSWQAGISPEFKHTCPPSKSTPMKCFVRYKTLMARGSFSIRLLCRRSPSIFTIS